MSIESIIQLVTILVALILGVVSKRNKFISNNLIPIQNVVIGLIMATIEFIITNDFSTAVALSGILAGGIYDIPSNLMKIKEAQEVVGDDPIVYTEEEVEDVVCDE